jgi:transcriptional regulator with XRE-family HTH domain
MPRTPQPRINGERSPTVLRHLRQACGLSQKDLARLSGVHQSVISDYENGLAMVETHARSLCSALKRCLAAPPGVNLETFHHLEVLQPTDLPRPWESVQPELVARMTHDNNSRPHNVVVA